MTYAAQIGDEMDEDEYENEGKDASYEPPTDVMHDSDNGMGACVLCASTFAPFPSRYTVIDVINVVSLYVRSIS